MAAAGAAEQVREAARRRGVEQRRAASGRAAAGGRGGWLLYRPIEDAPLHGLHGACGEGQPRAARGRSRRPSTRGQRAACGTRAQGVRRHADGLGAAPSRRYLGRECLETILMT